MEKGLAMLSVFLFAFSFVSLNFVSASALNVSMVPTTANSSQSAAYNFTIKDTDSVVNFTQVNITLPSGFILGSMSGFAGSWNTPNISKGTHTITISNFSIGGVLSHSSTGYYWFNVTNANSIGISNFTVTSLDTSNNTNSSNLSVMLTDVTFPKISFDSSMPSNDSTLNQSYILVKIDASDNVAVSNVSISIFGPSDNTTKTVTSSPYSYNFTNLSYGLYQVNATAYDASGNSNSTSLRYIILNSSPISCLENWTCGNWTLCSNGTQTRTCTDQNSCGTQVYEPPSSQVCVLDYCNGGKNASWDCGNYAPQNCTQGETQVQICTDLLSNCPPKNNTRLCPTSTNSGKKPYSLLFLGIIGFAVISIIVVVFVMMRLKNKRSQNENNQDDWHEFPHNPGYSPGPRY